MEQRRGAAQRRRALSRRRADRAGHHRRRSSPSTAASGRSPTTSGWSATTARWWCSTPPTITEPIVAAINGRRVQAIVLTHGHNDHINAAVPLRDAVDAPILLHPADRMLWDVVWPDSSARPATSCPASVDRRRRARAGRGAHARSLPRLLLLPRRRQRRRVQRRHAVLRRVPVPPAGATATSRRSCARSSRSAADAAGPRRSCTPATASRPRSAPNAKASSPAPPTSASSKPNCLLQIARGLI